MKTSDLIGPALDWAVAKCEGYQAGDFTHHDKFSTNWAQGGPIIEREKIQTGWWHTEWQAQNWQGNPNTQCGPTPLIAAMRCYVASKLGDDVEIPEELK